MDATYRYAIDASHALVSVSEEWLQFARENGAEELSREHVLGRPLWDFVAGDDTRRLYELLFDKVQRTGQPLSVPFRCDSPDRFRFMQLGLSRGHAGGIDLEGILLREHARPQLAWLDAVLPRSSRYVFPMCSLCKQIFVQGAWSETEVAIAKLGMLDSPSAPGLSYTVCERCSMLAGRERFTDTAR